MRTYSYLNNVFRMDIDTRGNSGFMEYDFNLGIFHSEKPSGVPSISWIGMILNFLRICQRFIEPLDYGQS